jgi:DNA-directed RNA polymerase
MYVRKARKAGIKAFVMIHDSFGTHACHVGLMDRLIREAFVEMYSQDVTKPYLDALAAQGTPFEEELPSGEFDIEEVLNSTYFFG